MANVESDIHDNQLSYSITARDFVREKKNKDKDLKEFNVSSRRNSPREGANYSEDTPRRSNSREGANYSEDTPRRSSPRENFNYVDEQ